MKLTTAFLLGWMSVSMVSTKAQSMVPSGMPSSSPSSLVPTETPATGPPTTSATPPPTAALFPTTAPIAPTPGNNDQCINTECAPGSDDCSCIPGLECRLRNDGIGNFVYLCSAVSKTTKTRISDGQGGAAGRNPERERIFGKP